ncbi:MAG: DUF58 domain-containing protein [Treponema sp.]|jgi:hypothetical protein|nr:DUF58 domain-containing protein [Treponema sp.]
MKKAYVRMTDRLKKIPLAIPGALVLVICLLVLVRALAALNAYEIVLSLAALALMGTLFLVGRLAVRRLSALEAVWQIPLPLTASSSRSWSVSCQGVNVPHFFRLHFLLRGKFFPQGCAPSCLVFAETSASGLLKSHSALPAKLDVSFPLGGVFQGETSCRLRDIFGLFSFPCGLALKQTLNVRSAPIGDQPLRLDALSGAEDRRSKSSNDEERYYMREYAPGDRFRDINWKSSERINTLITRISPDNQEKVTRIEVVFRNCSPSAKAPALADLWLLDRAKARLVWFLRRVREENGSYIFHIRSIGANWELNSDEEIDMFLEELPSVPFFPPPSEANTLPPSNGEVYIFSTTCDSALQAFISSLSGRPFSLFLAQSANPKKSVLQKLKAGSESEPNAQHLFYRDFLSGCFLPNPRWLKKPSANQLHVSGGRVMIDYAETLL